MSKDRLVSDGHQRLTESSELRAARSAVIASVRARYADQLAMAGIFRRLVLRFRMRREIAQELAKVASPESLYLRA